MESETTVVEALESSDGPEDLPHDLITDLSRCIKQRAKCLSLCRTEQSWAAVMVNNLRDSLIEFLKQCDQPYFHGIDILSSGSYYEMVKIDNPDEFDLMLLLPTPRLAWAELHDYDGLYYSVSVARPTRTEIQNFLLEDGLISTTKILEEMRRVVRKFVSTYKVPNGSGRWSLTRKRPTSPAVTLVLKAAEEENEVAEGGQEAEEGRMEGWDTREMISLDIVPALEVSTKQGWPSAVRQGLNVNRWLGTKVRRSLMSKAFYFVPKKPPGRNLCSKAKESWRISFSHIEKEIIMNHGNKKTCCEKNSHKCCRKLCLRLLKCLIKGLKQRYAHELEPLCSYHGKTIFLHTLSERWSDAMWAPSLLPRCFLKLLDALETCVRGASLPHFFVPTCNLFAHPAFPRRALQFLQGALEEQRKLGLPLLQVVHPEQPLSTNSGAWPSESSTSAGFALPWMNIITVLMLGLTFCAYYFKTISAN